MALFFPRSLLRERTGRLELGRRVISPGMGGTGNLPLIATDGGGLWELDYGAISLRTADHQRVWQALAAVSDGGVTPLVVPYCGSRTAPWPVVDGVIVRSTELPFDDDTLFDDDTGWFEPAIVVELLAAAALRATTLTVRISAGSPFQGGEHFSILHDVADWRLYRIVGVEEISEGLDYTLTIRPPLREACDEGTALDFDQPRCLMQLADPRALDLTMEMRRFAQVSASFIEAPV